MKGMEDMAYEILIVDDEPDIRRLIAEVLENEGYKARFASDGPSAIEAIALRRPSLAILDIWLGDSSFDGLRILEKLVSDHPLIPTVMMSGHGTIGTAVKAIKMGAYDFIEKPFKSDRLILVVKRAIELARLAQENQELKLKIGGEFKLVGQSKPFLMMKQSIDRVAATNSRILITGPAGSGKEVVARTIHERSNRSEWAFVVINCATLHPDRFEEELFGHEATSKDFEIKIGGFEQAHLGTLFLDEITDMPMTTQSKLVRALHGQTIQRAGSSRKVQVDVRVIASSSRRFESEIQKGRFREDLYYRLSVVPIQVPSLRERREDIPLLAQHFVDLSSEVNGRKPLRLKDQAALALQSYEWPGNVRQLKNAMDWILIMQVNGSEISHQITPEMLPPEIRSPSRDLQVQPNAEVLQLPLREAREVFERNYLEAQVDRFAGNISQKANFVGMERSALHRKLRILKVDRKT
jgi:two-component system nitrogen regulation response regulator NtrX